jgi:protein-S-isoprenylcysteine O-methyltransferase Ste14
MLIFIIVWSLWLISEILLNRLLHSGKQDKKDLDQGSIRIIWITIAVANSTGILFMLYSHIPISNLLIIPYAGLILIIVGMILRFFSVWSLGRLFTVDVTIRDHHRIKKDGIYRIIRHPSYSGSLLSFIGFGISLNNWISLIIISTLVTAAMLYRIKIEERMLMDQFGFEYLDYTKKTYRLIPWIY